MHRHYVLKYIYPGLYSRPSCRKKFSRERLGNRTGPAPPPTSPRKTHSCAQLSLLFPILKLVPLGGAGQDTRKHRLREGWPQGGARGKGGGGFQHILPGGKVGLSPAQGPPSEPRTSRKAALLCPHGAFRPKVQPRAAAAWSLRPAQMPLRLWKKQTAALRPPRALPLWTLSARGLPSLLVPETHEPVLSRTCWRLSRQPGAPNPVQAGLSMVGLHTCVFFLSLL